MSIRYISTKSTCFYNSPRGSARELVLIFGDEVNTVGEQQDGRDKVLYRGRQGWVKSDRLITDHPMEVYFIDVGQGDSVFIVTPKGRRILIDGGIGNEAFQFLTWKYRLDLPNPDIVDIDLMVVSHTDDDHIAGLIKILKHPLIQVREIVHGGIAKYRSGYNTSLGDTFDRGGKRFLVTRHDSIEDLSDQDLRDVLIDWRTAVKAEPNVKYRAVDSNTGNIDLDDPTVKLHVLGPRLVNHPGYANPAYPWFGSESHTVNGHSVILRLDHKNVRVLFSGDINRYGARHLMEGPNFIKDASAHVFKAPHHGSHEYEQSFLEAVNPQISVISSGESPDHGHPRANFLGAIGNVSRTDEPLVFSTELVAQFAVDADAEAPDADDDVNPSDPAMLGQARRRFKKRLNGIINVRTDGNDIYCARRVAAGYKFVTYKQRARPHNQ